MSDEIKRRFNHPCKDTCSGWKQGHDLGLDHGIIRGRNESKELHILAEQMAEALEDVQKYLCEKTYTCMPCPEGICATSHGAECESARHVLAAWTAFIERNQK